MKEPGAGKNAPNGNREFPFKVRTCNNICADSLIAPVFSVTSEPRCVVKKRSSPLANLAPPILHNPRKCGAPLPRNHIQLVEKPLTLGGMLQRGSLFLPACVNTE